MKKKITALCICIAMLAIALIGGTMAYFTDDKAQTNTFTAGSVGIELTEASVKKLNNGNVVEDTEAARIIATSTNAVNPIVNEYGNIYPAQIIWKDPTIKVDINSEDTYVAAKIIVTNNKEVGDLHDLIPMEDTTMELLDINRLVSGGLIESKNKMSFIEAANYENLFPVFTNGEYSIYQVKENDHSYVFYIFAEKVKEKGDEIKLFDTITIPKEWDNEEMAYLKDLSIRVEAYAVQAHGFTHDADDDKVTNACYKAMKEAFKDVF